MFADGLPEDVLALLRAHIESYEQLAALLLAYRDQKRDWSAAEVSSTLSIPAQLADVALASLQGAQLLQVSSNSSPPRFRYVASGTDDATVGRLAKVYAENPLQVVRSMNANAIQRVRGSALRAFADAFLLKKDKDRG